MRDLYAPPSDLPQVDDAPLWKVAVAVAIGLVVFAFGAAVLP